MDNGVFIILFIWGIGERGRGLFGRVVGGGSGVLGFFFVLF